MKKKTESEPMTAEEQKIRGLIGRPTKKELERMYNCRITFAEGQEFNNLISGEHENKSLEAVLQSMEYTSGIRYRKEGNHIFLFK